MSFIDLNEKINLLKKTFGHVRKYADGINVACICPNCLLDGKQKVKLAIRLDDGKFHCWICGIKGHSIVSLIKKHHYQHVSAAEKLFPKLGKSVDDAIVNEHERVMLPDGFMLLGDNINTKNQDLQDIIAYARSRNITEADMWRFRLGFSMSPKFKKRIIIPSFDAMGELNYYTSRDITNSVFPRYKNAIGKKQSIIYNELDVDWCSELTLVEGPFDVFKCTSNATCLFGSSLDKNFALFHKIVENSTPIVLALDADATTATQKIAKLLYSYDINVKILSTDGYKDVAEMSKAVFKQKFAKIKPWTPSSRLLNRIAAIGKN